MAHENLKRNMYTTDFFRSSCKYQRFYLSLADLLMSWFKPETVIDFGCGNGFIISRFRALGASVAGVEGSANAIDYMPENIRGAVKIADVTKPLDLGKFDLVVSTEVAEHLPEEQADSFLDNLTCHALSMIFFTAAEPGQGGTDHVNERPHEYWICKFGERGFVFLKEESGDMQKRLKLSWRGEDRRWAPWPLAWNAMLFKRATQKQDKTMINHQLVYSRVGLKLPVFIWRYAVNARKRAILRAIKLRLQAH